MPTLSSGPIPSGRLNNLMDIDKLASLNLNLSVREMSVTLKLRLYLCSEDSSNRALSPVVQGNIYSECKYITHKKVNTT